MKCHQSDTQSLTGLPCSKLNRTWVQLLIVIPSSHSENIDHNFTGIFGLFGVFLFRYDMLTFTDLSQQLILGETAGDEGSIQLQCHDIVARMLALVH